MKKIVLLLSLLAVSLFAQKAVFIDIVSENIIKVQKDGKLKRLHLSGIEVFSKANKKTKQLPLADKQVLKNTLISYFKKHIKVGEELNYSLIYEDDFGVERVWLDKDELNYKMVRDGYALVDMNDDFLPSTLKMRMTKAMKYAKDKKLGLWLDQKMELLIDSSVHMCGWENGAKVPTITKTSILNELKDALPNDAKFSLNEKIASKL